jgi:DNA-binding CsgD family transcriptional regulator/tetratricopeptide (TPR) repeat protein
MTLERIAPEDLSTHSSATAPMRGTDDSLATSAGSTSTGLLLERAEELAALEGAIASARSGEGRLLVIEGPAGIGKTSLLAEGRARANSAGLSVLQARSSELETAFSFGVVRQLYEPVLAQAEPRHLAALLDGSAAHAGRLLQREAEVVPPDEDVAFSLLHGLYWLTINLSEIHPLFIAIDDLQSADAPSLRWLSYLTRRIDGLPVCVAATIRPSARESPLLSELLVDPGTAPVRPKALSAVAVTELVLAELGTGADETFCRACHRTTGGNPLLLRELLRALAADSVPPVAASAGAVEHAAPDAVARSVRLRLSRLPSGARRLARAVAILGDSADRDQAATLARLDHRALATAAGTLARVELLQQQQPPFTFVHPLIRNAVYEDIPAEEREAEHARAAGIARAANANPAFAAAHVLLAAPGTVDGARRLLRDAAQQAAGEGGLDSAVRYLLRALDEPMEDEQQRADLLLALAEVELNLGSATVDVRLREAVSLFDEPKRRAEARCQLGRVLLWVGREEEAIREVEEALVHWRHPDDLRRRLEAIFVASATRLAGRFEEARRLLDSLELDAAEGPGARMLLGLRSFHEAARGGNRERSVAEAQKALHATAHDERRWAYGAAWSALWISDQLDESVVLLDTLVARARKAGEITYDAELSQGRATFHYARGALIEAEADAQVAVDVLQHRRVSFLDGAHSLLGQILVERGKIDEAAVIVDAGEHGTLADPDALARAPLLRARAMFAAARHDHERALLAARALGENHLAHGLVNPACSYPSWRSLAAQALFALGRIDEAVDLSREDVTQARSWRARRCLGRALRNLGTFEGGERGFEHLREAVDVLERSPARLELAYALTDLGGALRRANRRKEAREPLRRALELAYRCGAGALAERTREELLAAGARPRRRALSGVDALTPSERRIAVMAAQGLSNREIAQDLFLTPRTVEFHLSNTFRKLDISARTQLPVALAAEEVAAVRSRG